uniref:Wall-associated receptor kinase galacturonan-binding domain-containing protein n=1 Tax=Opuntia streptacantha TaxID=393608 RepID=A0A7C9DYJ8_OPUST
MRGRRGPKEGARSMSCSEWVIVAVVVLTITLSATSSESPSLISLPGCPESCGGIPIHYPFGVGDNCSYNKIFSITCNRTFNHPITRPIYHQNLEVLGIDLVQGQIRFSNNVSRACCKRLQSDCTNWTTVPSFTATNFTLNPTQNMFAATGCDTVGVLAGTRSLNRTSAYGCVTVCNSPSEVDNGTCAGAGCCKTTIPEGINSIEMTVSSVWNYKNTSKELTPCGSAFVVATDSFNFTLANLTTSPEEMPVSFPVVFDWTIGNQTCEVARANGDCLCCNQRGCECIDSKLGGYLCNCSLGYSGNPYLANGCQGDDFYCYYSSHLSRVLKFGFATHA